jgi:hypothetical protein
MEAKEWGEKTAVLSEDLGRKKIFGAKTTLISEGISGIQRLEAQEARSELRIEAVIAAKKQQNKCHLAHIVN